MLTPAQYHIYPHLLILFAAMLSTHLPNRTPTSSSAAQAHQESVQGMSLAILVGYYSHMTGLFQATVPEVLLLGPYTSVRQLHKEQSCHEMLPKHLHHLSTLHTHRLHSSDVFKTKAILYAIVLFLFMQSAKTNTNALVTVQCNSMLQQR